MLMEGVVLLADPHICWDLLSTNTLISVIWSMLWHADAFTNFHVLYGLVNFHLVVSYINLTWMCHWCLKFLLVCQFFLYSHISITCEPKSWLSSQPALFCFYLQVSEAVEPVGHWTEVVPTIKMLLNTLRWSTAPPKQRPPTFDVHELCSQSCISDMS